MPRYTVLVGMNYPPNQRVEPGDDVDNLPGKSITWLIEQGAIRPTTPPRTAKARAVKKAD